MGELHNPALGKLGHEYPRRGGFLTHYAVGFTFATQGHYAHFLDNCVTRVEIQRDDCI